MSQLIKLTLFTVYFTCFQCMEVVSFVFYKQCAQSVRENYNAVRKCQKLIFSVKCASDKRNVLYIMGV